MKRFQDLDANALRGSILAGERSAADAVEESLAAVAERDGALRAFLSLDAEGARARAAELDRELAAGRVPGPLFGVPVALKANLCRTDRPISCGSRVLAGWRAPYTATCVRRLLDAGAVPIGETNMDEFAMGSSGEHSAFGPTRNPWDPERTPGGSSSGSAAAVAAGLVPCALGSDTGGSVRLPAAFCGVAGFKPTYGRVSRHGLVAFGSSLDAISPLARSVRDLELVLSVVSGDDPRDATALAEPPVQPELGDHEGTLEGMRLGLPRELVELDLDPEARAAFEAALDALRDLGATVEDVSLPCSPHAIPTYYVVATAEASSNLARYDGVRYGLREPGDGSLAGMVAATRAAGFGAEVKRRVLMGTYVLSSGYHEAWYGKALRVRRRLRDDYERAFERVDALVAPTAAGPAFRLGERLQDPVAMYATDALTVPANLAGLPALSVPCGAARVGGRSLPLGLQIVGPARADARVLRIGRLYEEARGPAARPSGAPTGGRAS